MNKHYNEVKPCKQHIFNPTSWGKDPKSRKVDFYCAVCEKKIGSFTLPKNVANKVQYKITE